MGILFSGLWRKLIGREKPVRILMVGLDAAGKTTVLYQLKMGETVKTIPTIGFNVETVSYKGLSFTIWDIGGQDKIMALWKHYYSGSDAIIFVVDSNDEERLNFAGETLRIMMNDEELQNCSILVMANKQDLTGALSPSQVTEKMKLKELKGNKWLVQGTSAISGQGLQQGLDWLASVLLKGK